MPADHPVSFLAADGTSRLAGTCTLPDGDGPHAAALLIVGSGPVDRDSDHDRLALGVTREIAAALARAGIATWRYDKRGVGDSEGSYVETTFTDARDDAAAALAALRSRPDIDPRRVVVIGHSEGALHAAALGTAHPDLAGVVLLSGPAVTGAQVLAWQAERILPTLPRAVRALMRLLRQTPARAQTKLFARVRGTDRDVIRVQGVRLNAGWMRGFIDHDPAIDLAAIRMPVLAITGDLDLQVDPDDLARIEALVTHAPVEVHRLPGVNHILRTCEDGGRPGAYKRQVRSGQPVAPQVHELMSRWIGERTAVRS
ncbi:MAG: alpha/beta fold hydrolase [Nitriliruptoraceae bacterium]|nr:alpha/beta fold hydrolase [Nitriliruptoraceae bacterium]